MITDFRQLASRVAGASPARLACAAAQDLDSLQALSEAAAKGLIVPILVGEEEKIRGLIRDEVPALEGCEIIPASTLEEAAAKAVECVRTGHAEFLMKGLVDTNIFLKAILNKESGLPVSGVLSHVMVFEPSKAFYPKLLITTDGGMILYPTLEQKKHILKNALAVAEALEVEEPKVAVLCAKEKPNPKMPATMDAAELKQLGQEGYFGEKTIVEGPISMDLALSARAAEVKSFCSPVAGEADILLVPNIEAGNIMGKTMSTLYGAPAAGVVVGCGVPLVLCSRADSAESKFYSIALGCAMAQKNRGES